MRVALRLGRASSMIPSLRRGRVGGGIRTLALGLGALGAVTGGAACRSTVTKASGSGGAASATIAASSGMTGVSGNTATGTGSGWDCTPKPGDIGCTSQIKSSGCCSQMKATASTDACAADPQCAYCAACVPANCYDPFLCPGCTAAPMPMGGAFGNCADIFWKGCGYPGECASATGTGTTSGGG